MLGRKQQSQVARSFPNRYLFSYANKVTSLFSISCILDVILLCKEDELDVTIADTTLEDEILSHMYAGDEMEDKAFAMDDKIAFFILPNEWKLDEEHLIKIVESSY